MTRFTVPIRPGQWDGLNDAMLYLHTAYTAITEVWYAKPEHARAARLGDLVPNAAELAHTHTRVGSTNRFAATGNAPLGGDGPGNEAVWVAMQAENWSPNGEAAALIQRLGLDHTSMSVGDVVRWLFADGHVETYLVQPSGFSELE